MMPRSEIAARTVTAHSIAQATEVLYGPKRWSTWLANHIARTWARAARNLGVTPEEIAEEARSRGL